MTIKQPLIALLSLGLLSAQPALADDQASSDVDGFKEKLYLFTSKDDPDLEPNHEFCYSAPFNSNTTVAASLWSVQTNIGTSRLIDDGVVQVGTATACLELSDEGFEIGGMVPMHVEFVFGRMILNATGACLSTTAGVPADGVVLSGCTLDILDSPTHRKVLGGMASSNSLFNLGGVPGLNTGSVWAMRVYKDKK